MAKIETIRSYLKKNGKRSKTTATALALAGLTALSTTTMFSCDQISQIITPNESTSSNVPDINKGSYPGPIVKTPQEIQEAGITAEDVLAEFDRLVWDIAIINYTGYCKIYYPDTWQQALEDSDIYAQFVKLTPPLNNELNPFPMYGIVTTQQGYVQFNYSLQEQDHKNFYDVYPISLFYDGMSLEYESLITVGAHKDQFQPVGDLLADEKYILTEDKINQICEQFDGIFECYDFENSQGYSAFEITRDTIQNASQEELYALYDLARSIRSISIDLEYPNFSPINNETESGQETN